MAISQLSRQFYLLDPTTNMDAVVKIAIHNAERGERGRELHSWPATVCFVRQ